jgi:predicted O-methyltransferase YrrM
MFQHKMRGESMLTLTQPTLSMLIDRLFAEADAAENVRSPAAHASDRSDYRQYYGLLKDQPLPVSRATGRLLYMLARSVRARTIVEFGTSFGISTLHLAAALRDNGGGRLIGRNVYDPVYAPNSKGGPKADPTQDEVLAF